jgi:cytochrome c-type biogenesis protein
MSADVTIVAALLAGLLSFLSPCVLPLVPPYLVYLAGASLERLADAEPEPQVRRATVLAAAVFVAGFSTVFVALGATASTIGRWLIVSRAWFSDALGTLKATLGLPAALDVDPFTLLAGIAIILMGLHFLNVFRVGWLMQERRVHVAKPVGLWGAYAMGLAFAFGWTPCIGPILAAILAVATVKETVLKGAGLLAVYSAGLGIPFILAAFAVEPFASFLARFKRHLGMVEKAMGVFLILTGLALAFTNVFADVSAWLLEWFPGLSRIG